ncbi:MAG: FHA domain-containing protein [Chitinivibrionales bacterium]|nr:FHA domain-containing protein [Chitinivibrionales bacterium]
MEWRFEIENMITHETARYSVQDNEVLVGRHSGNTVVIPNKFVSRLHVIISCAHGAYTIEDKNSANGTFIQAKGKREQLWGKKNFIPPLQCMLGKEIAVWIATNEKPLDNQRTAIHCVPKGTSVQSQILSIENMESLQAIMVLDICDSTRLANEDERMAIHLKHRIQDISLRALQNHSVDFYKNTGDGFLASFDSSLDALHAGEEILQKVNQRNSRTRNAPLHIRLALHKGKTYKLGADKNDLHGNDVNIAFRIEGLQEKSFTALVHGMPEKNRILCSKFFYADVIKKATATRDKFLYCGQASLKGIARPVEIFRIHQ